MRDDASLRRLAEMGVDVYVPRRVGADPRSSAQVPASSAPGPKATAAVEAGQATSDGVDVLLLADAHTPAAKKLLADVTRALAFAQVASAPAPASDATALASAAALVMFGAAQARAAGALLSAPRQGEMGWVVSGELAALVGDARAKRALWSELRRMLRGLASRAWR